MKIGGSHSLLASANLASTSKAIARALTRLSTGRRVNSPADGAADYRLSLSLDSQVRGLYAANLGINRAMGMVQTADSAVGSLIDIIQRMKEIANEGANGSLGTTDRKTLNTELQSLLEEFDRITQTTEFDQIQLLHGGLDNLQIQTGADAGDSMSFSLPELKSSELFEITVGTGDFEETLNLDAGVVSFRNRFTIDDLNNDGNQDIIHNGDSTYGLYVYLGNGDGSFQALATYESNGANQTKLADINEDGIMDVVSMNASDAYIYMGNGDGTLQAPILADFTAASHAGVAIGDIDGDGHLDLVSNFNQPWYLSGNGDGTFKAASILWPSGLNNSDSTEIADLNNDGNLDIIGVQRDSGYKTVVFLGNGDGSFQAMVTIESQDYNKLVPIADFNNDGNLDIITLHQSISNTSEMGYSVALGNGDGSFQAPTSYVSHTSANSFMRTAGIGDFNGDGNMDFTAGSGGSIDELRIFLGNGDGTFRILSEDVNSDNWLVAVGDLNNDGAPDIVSGEYLNDTFEVFINQTEQATAISKLNVDDIAAATTLMGILENTLDRLTEERANLGVIHSRLERTTAANLLQAETLTEARSNIVNADLALETAELVKQQILQQAAVAVQAQANVQLQVVLELLN